MQKKFNLVEIETFSKCNRQCKWCPNSIIDRQSFQNYLLEELYLKVLNELKDNPPKIISFSRYNEPLLDPIIFKRIKQTKKILPKTKLSINTNGDYLTPLILKKLYNCGLNNLNIQIYSNIIENEVKRYVIILNLNNLKIIFKNQNKIEWQSYYKKISVNFKWQNFDKIGINRGGIITNYNKNKRISPCIIPFNNIYIDYNGNVMPCCNLRSDWDLHKPFILGNIKQNTIYEIFNSFKAKQFRKQLNKWGNKTFPCNYCHFSEISLDRKSKI